MLKKTCDLKRLLSTCSLCGRSVVLQRSLAVLLLAALRTRAAVRTRSQVRLAASAYLGFARQETSACVSVAICGLINPRIKRL